MNRIPTLIIMLLILSAGICLGQNTIMSYNLLNYPNDTTRNQYFRTIIAAVQPDILVVQEMTTSDGVTGFLNNVLNSISSGYAAGPFLDGPDTDNAIFFKNALFTCISNIALHTALRDINEFTLRSNLSGDTLRIYSVHLKASTGFEVQRGMEVDTLRKRTNSLPPGSNFIVVGDFNMYSANEIGYQKLISQSSSGYFIDPFTMPGDWNVSAYSQFHTQSPRVRAFGGGSTGGMDDRFDMILYSQGLANPGGITYVPNSCKAYGNDGNHFNDSINKPPNNAVSQQIADALHNGSDHIPVYSKFDFGGTSAYTLTSFTALIEGLYNGITMIPDTAVIEIRSSSAPYALIDQKNIILDQNGSGSSTFNNVINGVPYYLVLKHRSGIETWSATTQMFSSNSMTYNFTAAQNKAYGNNQVLIGSKWCIFSGDVNRDGLINTTDLNQVYNSNVSGTTGYSASDLNGDLFTEIADINIVFKNKTAGIVRQVPPGYPGKLNQNLK